MADGALLDQSPLALAADELLSLGFHVLPILPPTAGPEGRGKAPGEFKSGRWYGLKDWQRYRDRPPSGFELPLWRAWPDANVGAALGSPIGALRLLAVDVDTTDPDEFDEIVRALPHSPMSKKGAKGITLFYAAPGDIKSKGYKVGPTGAKRTLVDLLTGNQTRQTVMPPSVHPDGMAYAWITGPVSVADLPVFDEDSLAVLEETLEGLGWGAPDEAQPSLSAPAASVMKDSDDPPTVWRDLNDEALAKLAEWVPALILHGLRAVRCGYEAVATWRASSTGQALEKRKRNLKIHPSGIRDMGDDRTYTALDLIQAAQSCELDAAFGWLSARLGHPVMALTMQRAREVNESGSGSLVDARTGEVVEIPTSDGPGELPERLTRPGGLVEEITDWICATARRPSRILALGAALTIVGTVAGRQFSGPTGSGTHLYVLLLARTGAGKDHPLQSIARLLQAASLGQHVGPSEYISMPAAIRHLTRSPLSVCPMDELGAFIQRINNRRASGFEAAISKVLRTAWGSSFATMTTPEWAQVESRTIHAPALSICGASTPEEFFQALEATDTSNGLLNRFLILETRSRPRQSNPPLNPHAPPPTSIIEGLRAVYYAGGQLLAAGVNQFDTQRTPTEVPWSPDAAAIFQALADRADRVEGPAADLMARTAETAVRLATIAALGRDPAAPNISARDMEWAREIALFAAKTLISGAGEYMAVNDTQAASNRVLRTIRDARRISHRELLRRLQRQFKSRELKEIVDGLSASGDIELLEVTPPGGGQRTITYVANVEEAGV